MLDAEGRRAMGHPDPGRQPGRYARSLDEPKNTTTPPLNRSRSDFIRLGRTADNHRRSTFTVSLVSDILLERRSVYHRVRSPYAGLQRKRLHLLLKHLHSIFRASLRVWISASTTLVSLWEPKSDFLLREAIAQPAFDYRIRHRYSPGISRHERSAIFQEHGHNSACMVLTRLVRLATGMVYLRKSATTIGHLTGQGIRIRIYVQGSRFGVFAQPGAWTSRCLFRPGLSSQRSESETKPHMASQTASHLQRRLPILGSSQDFSAIKMLRVRGDIDECDCKSGQEPGDLARGGVAAWQPHLLGHSGPLGAAETERAKLIWVLHQVIGSSRHHGCVVQSGWSVGMDYSIYPHHCLPAGFVTCLNAAELAVFLDPISLTGPHSTLAESSDPLFFSSTLPHCS